MKACLLGWIEKFFLQFQHGGVYGASCVKLRNIKFCIIFLVNFG